MSIEKKQSAHPKVKIPLLHLVGHLRVYQIEKVLTVLLVKVRVENSHVHLNCFWHNNIQLTPTHLTIRLPKLTESLTDQLPGREWMLMFHLIAGRDEISLLC